MPWWCSTRAGGARRPASVRPPCYWATSWSETAPPERRRRSGRRVPPRALSHLDAAGAARMVDVSAKPATAREAVARGRVAIAPAAMRLARAGRLKKGGLIEVARVAGVMAAKRTAEAIPLCHPLALTHVDVDLT